MTLYYFAEDMKGNRIEEDMSILRKRNDLHTITIYGVINDKKIMIILYPQTGCINISDQKGFGKPIKLIQKENFIILLEINNSTFEIGFEVDETKESVKLDLCTGEVWAKYG